MNRVSFTVRGRARPQGSKRPFVNRHTGRVQLVEQSKHLGDWRSVVAYTAAQHTEQWMVECVGVDLTFVFERPKSHYRTGKFSSVLRDDAPAWPNSRSTGDLDKLVRAVADAITGPVLADDSLIATLTARKVYGSPERVEVTVAELGQPLDYEVAA